jgi:hypothetical protein
MVVGYGDDEDVVGFDGIQQAIGNLWSRHFLMSPPPAAHAWGYFAMRRAAFRTSDLNALPKPSNAVS